ncbi:MAG: flotillin family protein [Spirochaetes bacterium]|nr:flotillin family protein [Spirochaetota bacterium]
MSVLFPVLLASGGVLAALIIFFVIIKLRYYRIKPNEIIIVYGRRQHPDDMSSGDTAGFRIVENGGTFVIPLIERVTSLSLATMTISFSLKGVLTKLGVPVNLMGIAEIKLRADAKAIAKAAPLILDKPLDEIKRMAVNILEGHLIEALGTIDPEMLFLRLPEVNKKFIEASRDDLLKIGYETVTLTVEKAWDDNGYFEALGRSQLADVKAEASIGEAKANVKRLKAERDLAEATKGYEAEIAQYQRIINENRAKSELAYEIEKTKAERGR